LGTLIAASLTLPVSRCSYAFPLARRTPAFAGSGAALAGMLRPVPEAPDVGAGTRWWADAQVASPALAARSAPLLARELTSERSAPSGGESASQRREKLRPAACVRAPACGRIRSRAAREDPKGPDESFL
jgi:hypothetical protein